MIKIVPEASIIQRSKLKSIDTFDFSYYGFGQNRAGPICKALAKLKFVKR